MRALVFAPMHNSDGKRDATGAFIPEARGFCLHHKLMPDHVVKLFNNYLPMEARAVQVTLWIRRAVPRSVDTVALFGHGWKEGIQHGFRLGDAARLAQALSEVCTKTPTIILYCCDTGRDDDAERDDDKQAAPGGDGGFADKLRDELGRRAIAATIYAHTTAGHTTCNPWVRRFDPGEMCGGHYVISRQSDLWQDWCRALRGTLRFRFPFMTTEEIERELTTAREGVA